MQETLAVFAQIAYTGGGTRADTALRMATEISEKRASDVPLVVVFISDGNSQTPLDQIPPWAVVRS